MENKKIKIGLLPRLIIAIILGVIIGNKPVKVKDEEYTLIAVAVRGGGYEQEWASNFTIGTSGQHQGFNTAKNNVLSYLKF